MTPARAVLVAAAIATALPAIVDPVRADELADAVASGSVERVTALLETANLGDRINERAAYGMTPLLFAVQANDLDLAALLLEAGADPSLGNAYGITPLWLAATNVSPAMTALLLEYGADAEFKMAHGENALMAAGRAGDAESIRLLIAAGADPNASERKHGETALIWAAAEDHADALRALVAGGADPDRQSLALDLAPMDWVQIGMVSTVLPAGGWSPLMYAAREDARAAAGALAAVGADLDLQDADGTTALGIAIINAHYDLAAALLEAGADPNVADKTGMTALYGAVDMVFFRSDIGRPPQPNTSSLTATDIVRLALESGADPNARLLGPIIGRHHGFGDFALGAGATALMRAAKGDDLEIMRRLLEAGADASIPMADGQTVIDLVAGRPGGRGRASPPNEAALALLAEYGFAAE